MAGIKIFHIFTLLSAVLCVSQCLKLSSIDKTYKKGIQAYEGERWSECILQFEESIHLYKLYKAIILNCRHKCHSDLFETEIKSNLDDLKIYETFFNKKNCLISCQKQGLEDVHLLTEVSESTLHHMQSRRPYEYIHICYFQMNALPKAASATYTYLVAHPDDTQMKENLDYYKAQSEVDANEIIDLESEKYKTLYYAANKAYNQNNWKDTIANMEEVLIDYLSSENFCRLECERLPNQEWNSEYVITISNTVAALLHCQQQCQDKVKILNYKSGPEFLADILHYLQISYYHMEKHQEAAEAVATFLMIEPEDDVMLKNKKIYSSLVDSKAFVVRSDIFDYMTRDKYEKKLLNLYHQGSDNTNNV